MAQPKKELRIGLVLYGGVSLAVYMHGVVTEIWNALRASRARACKDKPSKGTAEVYRELMRELETLYGGNDLRIVVDTIAGTSAGGVNGVVLGKAIATGDNASVLDDTWVERAGIGQLKAHPHKRTPWWLRVLDNVLAVLWSSFRKLRRYLDGTPGINWVWARDHIYSLFTSNNPKKTPLNGNYFTRIIAGTLENMSSPPPDANRSSPQPDPKLLPRGGRLDLVLTSTDLHGWPRHLPVDPRFHDELVEIEHAHRMRFRFHRPLGQSLKGGGGDFHKDEDFALTYAARATAGFPIAFAPVSYRTAAKSFKKERFNDRLPDQDEFAARHLPEHHLAGYKASKVWMVDGGILDNKPFSAAIRLIEEKPANRAVYRRLIYVEPDPALVGSARSARLRMPLPRTMPSLLYKLFRHEPIFADLQTVAARNRIVRRLIAIADAAGAHGKRVMQQDLDERPRDLENLRAAANDRLRTGNNPAYPGYTVLKAQRAADTLAGSISEALGYPHESRHGYFVRQVVRGFFQQKRAFDPPSYNADTQTFDSNASQIELLRVFDVPYRLRRLRYLVRVANDQYGEHKIDADEYMDVDGHADEHIDALKLALMQAAWEFDSLTEWVREHREEVRAYLQQGVGADLDAYIRGYAGELSEIDSASFPGMENLCLWLSAHFGQTMNDQGEAVRKAISNLPSSLFEPLSRAYVVYPMIDAAIFPMMDSAKVRDLSTIRVFRISPHDATTLSRNPRRLKSRELGGFAGFLRRHSREHDLLWGRLDGAERLIDLIIAAGTDRTDHTTGQQAQLQSLRNKAVHAAFGKILDEAESEASSKLRRVIACLRGRLPT